MLRIQSAWATSARRLMEGEASGKKVEEDGLAYSAMSNIEVLAFWGLASAETELRIVRLRWWQSIATEPERHEQILAAMFGENCHQ